jgi:uncharacterized protein
MSGKRLPGQLDLRRLADEEAVLAGSVPNSAMPRLISALADDEGETQAEISFRRDPVRRPTISGSARTEVTLVCQRCMEAFRRPLETEFELVVVGSESEGEHLPEGIEPLLTDREQIETVELLEDELILALPVVAMHAEDTGCRIQVGEQPAASDEGEQGRPNPFAALEALKRKKD